MLTLAVCMQFGAIYHIPVSTMRNTSPPPAQRLTRSSLRPFVILSLLGLLAQFVTPATAQPWHDHVRNPKDAIRRSIMTRCR